MKNVYISLAEVCHIHLKSHRKIQGSLHTKSVLEGINKRLPPLSLCELKPHRLPASARSQASPHAQDANLSFALLIYTAEVATPEPKVSPRSTSEIRKSIRGRSTPSVFLLAKQGESSRTSAVPPSIAGRTCVSFMARDLAVIFFLFFLDLCFMLFGL